MSTTAGRLLRLHHHLALSSRHEQGCSSAAAAAGSSSGGGAAYEEEGALARLEQLRSERPDNIAVQSFDRDYYDSLSPELRARLLACVKSGVENPDSSMGAYAMQPSDYDDLRPFFRAALSAYHKVPTDARHHNSWSLGGLRGLPDDGVLDIAALGLPALSMRVRVGRNLAAFPLPGAMEAEQRRALEGFLQPAFAALIALPGYGGRYVSITPGHPQEISAAEYEELVAKHIMFKDMSADEYLLSAGIASDWPEGRGCYISDDEQFIIWVGEEDHLRIVCMESGTRLDAVFLRLRSALEVVEGIQGLDFAMSEDYGVVTSCPTNLGTAMRASVHLALPKLCADGTETRAKAIAKPLGLSVRGLGGEHTPIGADGTVDISPSARFCITEGQIIADLYQGLAQLQAAEAAEA
jgi:protein-arginine kinase